MLALGEYGAGDKASTLKQRDYKDATDLVVQVYENHGQDSRIKQVELCPQAFTQNQAGDVLVNERMHSLATNSNATGRNSANVMIRGTVRRLTPLECGRLQGFPDNWCQIPWKGKPAAQCPDGPQYKAYGNAIAVVVIRKLGQRIMIVERLLTSRKLTIIHP